MDINETNIAEEENTTGEETVELDEDGWPDTWGNLSEDDTTSDDEDGELDFAEEPEESAETDQPEAEPEETEQTETQEESAEPDAAEGETHEQDQGTDQFFELKHLGETRKVSRDEAVTLAQKGLDYDRIRGERDAMNKDYQTLKSYEAFLNELKGDFPSIEALMTDTRARVLAKEKGISYADAVAEVGLRNQPQTQSAPKENADRPRETERTEAVDAFVRKYPNVKAEDIPAQVWDDVRRTGDLLGAYENYTTVKAANDKIAALEEQVQALKQNQKNAARSAGSASSSGKTNSKSLMQKLWDEDDY